MIGGEFDNWSRDGLVGQVIGEHEVLELIGSGGMSEVYLVRHRTLGVSRAIKVLRTDLQDRPKLAERLRREAVALSQLHHDNIVEVFDFGRLSSGALFLVMEYVKGHDLRQEVTAQGPLSLERLVRILAQLASALDYAHRRAIVHRDLKPSNLLLSQEEPDRLKVIDFGLAKLLADDSATMLTEPDKPIGSPLFWAPEQAGGEPVGAPADVYGLAAVAYYLASARPVFHPRPLPMLVLAQTEEPPEPLRQRRDDIPAQLEALLLSCLAKVPADRPTASQVVLALAELLTSQEAEEPAWDDLDDEVTVATADLIWAAERAELAMATRIDHQVELQEALFNQLNAALDELGTALAAGGVQSVAAPLERIAGLRAAIEELETDAALIDSQLDDLPTSSKSHAEGLRRQRARAEAQAAELEVLLGGEQRELYRQVQRARSRASSAGLEHLYGELDAIVARYRGISNR